MRVFKESTRGLSNRSSLEITGIMDMMVTSVLSTMGKHVAGSERLDLAPKVLQNPWGSVGRFYSKSSTTRNLPQKPLQNPKRSRILGGGGCGISTNT